MTSSRPYSFIALTQLTAYQSLWGFTLHLQPVFQGAVMKGANNTPPALVPAKQAYLMTADLQRLSRYHHLPLVVPSNFSTFMFHTLGTMRTLAAVQLLLPDKVRAPACTRPSARHSAAADRWLPLASPFTHPPLLPLCDASWLW